MNTTIDAARRPQPPANPLSRPYWEAAAQGRLLLQYCAACGLPRHYPRLLCSACYSDRVEWRQAAISGQVHSWTVAHHAFHPAFKHDLPYTLVTIDLDAGVRALGRWAGAQTPRIGQPVQGEFQPHDAGVDLVFMPQSQDILSGTETIPDPQ
jgi:uncharacterized protein